jgi:hypothetical protein
METTEEPKAVEAAPAPKPRKRVTKAAPAKNDPAA